VLLLERQSETVDDRTENLEQFGNSIVPFRFVDEVEEDIVHRSSNEGSQVEELAVYPMQCGLEEVSFSRILAIE
jgi:hypothetical protein